jgi:hypothetical protein
MLTSRPSLTINLEVEINYSQIYIYAEAPWADDPAGYDAVLEALNDARESQRFVGTARGVIDLVTPVQWNPHTPMRVEVWPSEPPSDEDNWDHVVDVDLDVPNDELYFEGSGGGEPIVCEVPTGTYRVRVSGRGYAEAGTHHVEGMDSYRLQLWPREKPMAPKLRKHWPHFH